MSKLTERILFFKFVRILKFGKIREFREFVKFIKFEFSIYVGTVFTDNMTHPTNSVKHWRKPADHWDQTLIPPWPLHHLKHKAIVSQHSVRQWFLTWGPGTSWGSQTPILGVPNANLEYQQISPNIFASHSLRVALCTVYTLRTLSYLASHSSSVFSSFLFSL